MNTHFKPARLSSRLSAVRPSPTIAITRRANELRRQGRDVIGLSQGEVSLIIR
jgi:aspartate aminotransferase